jgi:arylsulfatase A-like enzyme
MNENLDAGIGMVLDRIEELGVADNTCVIYTADNGYELKKDKGKPVAERQFYQAFPQRSHKYTVSEGGIRVPFIVRGPGIPAGSHSGSPVVGTDIFPTVMDLASGSKHIPKRVEGASLTAHLKSGGKDAIDRKDSFFVFKYFKPNGRHDVAIVDGDYKLIKDIDVDERYLFNLAQDVGESDNLANDEPERVDSLYGAMTSYFARFGWDESQAKAEGKSEKQRKKKTGQQSDNVRAITRPVSTLVETTSSDKPDVLFIAIDDMNDWTTLFDDDNPIQTPNLKRLAARGAFFSKAYCAVPACNPSRTAILTGLSPVTSGVYGNGQSWKELLPDVVTLPQYFGQHGFTTKGGGKIFHHGGTGTDREDNPSFDEFLNYGFTRASPKQTTTATNAVMKVSVDWRHKAGTGAFTTLTNRPTNSPSSTSFSDCPAHL